MDNSMNIVSSFRSVGDSFSQPAAVGKDKVGHKYIFLSKEKGISAQDKASSSKPKGAASFQEITQYVKALMEDRHTTKLNYSEKAEVLKHFAKITEHYREKEMGFFVKIFGIQTRRFNEANVILTKHYSNILKQWNNPKLSEIGVFIPLSDTDTKQTIEQLIEKHAKEFGVPKESIRVLIGGRQQFDPETSLESFGASLNGYWIKISKGSNTPKTLDSAPPLNQLKVVTAPKQKTIKKSITQPLPLQPPKLNPYDVLPSTRGPGPITSQIKDKNQTASPRPIQGFIEIQNSGDAVTIDIPDYNTIKCGEYTAAVAKKLGVSPDSVEIFIDLPGNKTVNLNDPNNTDLLLKELYNPERMIPRVKISPK